MAKNYYDILGVSKSASKEELKKAYYKLAHQYHPHKGGSSSDEGKMKEVNEAYQVLKDDQKRTQYDQFGSAFSGAGGFRGGQGASGAGNFSDFADMFRNAQGGGAQGFEFNVNDIGDIFGDFFGGGRSPSRGTRRARGSDIEVDVTLSLRDAVFGKEHTLRLNKDAHCERCSGEGAEPGSKVSTCGTCRGTGQVVRTVGFGIGFPSVCSECGGAGKMVDQKCKDCGGDGIKKVTQDINIKIPAGIDEGQAIKLTSQGAAGQKGGPAGDLYVRVHVQPDSRFDRQGYDLALVQEVSFVQAALGDKVEIETLDGTVKLKIPEGTQPGKVFRVRDKGVPHLNDRGRGDLLVKIQVHVPSKLSKEQRKILEDLDL